MSILSHTQVDVNSQIITIRAFDRQKEWTIEVVFKGGVKLSFQATMDEVNALESELAEMAGWRVNPSLYNDGFSARWLGVEGEDAIPFSGQPCYIYENIGM